MDLDRPRTRSSVDNSWAPSFPVVGAAEVKTSLAALAVALLLAEGPVTILAHGLFGLGSIFTGCFLALLISFLIAVSFQHWKTISVVDYLTFAFAASCALSVVLHPTDLRQSLLLSLTLGCYAAARGQRGVLSNQVFISTIAIFVAIGSTATFIAFWYSEDHGKPTIFGYDHASAQFSMLLAFFIFSVAISRPRLSYPVLGFVATSLAIFSAAQVRAALAALLMSLVFGSIISPSTRRRFAVLSAILIVSLGAGALSRLTMTMEYMRYVEDSVTRPIITAEAGQPATAPPRRVGLANWIPAPGCPEINLNNSIEMRRQLYKDGFALLPTAGLTGLGLGRFAEISCIKAEAHNSILQTAVELGWVSAVILSGLILVAAVSLLKNARKDDQAMLALCSLAFAFLIACVHGRITEDFTLFLALGYSAAILDNPDDVVANNRRLTDGMP